MDVRQATPSSPEPTASKPTDPTAALPAGGDEKRAGSALLWKGAQLGATKVLYLLGTLLLGRLLTPHDFGLVAVATVAITTVMFATETGMTNALVQATSRDRENYDVAWTIGLLRGTLVCVGLWLAAPYVAKLFGDVRAASLVQWMALVPLLNSLNSPRMADLMRELRFSRLATLAIAAVVVELTVSITLSFSLGGKAIVLGKVAGAATTTVASYFVAPYLPRIRPNYASARQLVAFGRWLFAIGLTGVIVDFFTKVLVSRNLSVAGLGIFSLSDRLAELPYTMGSEAIGAVAFPLYARLRADPPRLESAVRAHLIGIMFLLLPASALIIGLAQPLEERVLGAAWHGAAPVIVLLTLGYACEVSFNVVYFLLQALGQGARLFAAEFTQYVVLITSVSLLAGPYGLMGIGAARILTAVVVTFAGRKAAPPMFAKILRDSLRTAFAIVTFSAVAGLIAYETTRLVPGLAGVAVGLATGGAGYLALVASSDVRLSLGVRNALALFFPVLSAKSTGR